MTAPEHDPGLRAALQLIAEHLGARAERVAPDRYRVITLEPEGVTRYTYASRNALLWIGERIRTHEDFWRHAHFWQRWERSDKFRL